MDTRRHFIERAAQAAFGLSILPNFSANANPVEKVRGTGFGAAKNIILVNIKGGMSQVDTFDPKEKSGIKGPGEAVSSAGEYQVTNYLPNIAKVADQLSIIRTMTAKIGVHGPAQYFMRTAFAERNTIKHPNLGAWAHHYLGASHDTLPSSACILEGPRYGNGFFAPSFSPIPILNPASGLDNIKIEGGTDQLKQKLSLGEKLSSDFLAKYNDSNVSAYGEFYEQTLRMLRSKELNAFDITKENEKTRSRYGDSQFGQGCLLARRLVEAGIRYIEITSDGWDMHQDIKGDMDDVCPAFDQGFAALISDLKERGLLETTLVVMATEFGRKPKFEGKGRGHYPTAFTVGLAGAGVKQGFAFGDSGENCDDPDKPVTIGDFHATIAHAAGLPREEPFTTATGRPFYIGGEDAKVITEMFA